MSKKQVGLTIQLGQATEELQAMVLGSASKMEKEGDGLFGSWRLFGSRESTATLFTELQQLEDAKIIAFLNRFSEIAKREQEEFDIPASIILSNALLQSVGGESTLVERGNNFFALKCTPDWKGPELNVDGKCYRAYSNAFTSFRDHSLYITSGHYSELRLLGNTNYKSWAKELERKGFNDLSKMEEQLLSAINKWQLFRFDQ